jgi:outer membrane protein OmpA-like peptidoglycan-associated protein
VLVTTQFADANLELHAQWQKNKVAASKKLKVLFKANSWSLSRANKEKIKAFVKRYTLKSRANIVITILGFVEPTKATANDIALSKKRAHAVTYFLKTIGVKAKFKAIAKGKMSYTLSGARRATIVVDWSSQLK